MAPRSTFRSVLGRAFRRAVLCAVACAPALADGQFHAEQVDERGGVPIVELTGTYDSELPGAIANFEPREAVAREFYRTHGDDYDFLIVFTSFQFQTGDGIAFHWSVRNTVQGIGIPPIDLGSDFGSPQRLLGYVDMAPLSAVESDPLRPEFETTLSILSHELLHQWAARVHFRDQDGALSNELLGRKQSHWSFLFDSGASVEYGNTWHDNGDGTFTSTAGWRRYGPLDLYLAGFFRPDEVPPLRLLRSAGVDPERLPELGVTLSASPRTVTVEDVIAAEGPRVPDAAHAQHAFRAALLFLTRPGDVVNEAQLAALDRIRRAAAVHFAALTGGRGSLEIGLGVAPPPGSTPTGNDGGALRTTPVSLSDAFAWLRSRQDPQGFWEDDPATRGRDSAVVLPVLTTYDALFDPAHAALARSWLESSAPPNTDTLARTAVVLGSAERRSQLAVQRNADRGWGLGAGYGSDPLDSSYAALAVAGTADGAGTADYLLSRQNPDGGWPNVPGGSSRTLATTAALQALCSLEGAAAHVAEIDRAFAWLAAKQNADGGFGDSPSTAHDTAAALLAAIDYRRTATLRAGDAASYLGSHQTVAGSWEGSTATTAAAATALARFDLPNWRLVAPLRLAPAQPRDGDRVVVQIAVASDGRVGTPAGLVRLSDGASGSGIPIGDVAVPALESGTSTTVSILWDTRDAAGQHELTAIVDPQGAVEQSTRADDATTLSVAVAPAATGVELELRAVDLSVTPAHPATLPAALTVSAGVRNNGHADAPTVRVRLVEGTAVVGEKLVAIPGRSSTAVSFDYTLTSRGAKLLTVVVDPLDELSEADETNNSASITVAADATVDLAVAPEDLRLEAPAFVGGDATFLVTLHNRGTEDAPSAAVVFTVSDGVTTRTLPAASVAIPAGGAVTRTVTWRVDLAGDLEFAVTVDPAAAVSDVDRTNNQASLSFHAASGVELNLVVGRGDLSIDPTPGCEGRPLTATATVHNVGTSDAVDVEVVFYQGDPAHGGAALGDPQVVARVPAGGSANAAVSLSRLEGTQQRLMYVVVDPASHLAEATRADNATFVVLDVLSLPDPAISTASLRLRPGVPIPGQPVDLEVAIQNLGQQAANGLPVRAYEGDPAHGGTVVAEGSADVAGSSTASVTLSWTATAGSHALFVVLDPEQTLDESTRTNDAASLAYVSQDGDFVVSERYLSPNRDGVQDSTELGFRLGGPATISVEVLDRRNRVVRHSAPAQFDGVAQGQFEWDGRDDAGQVVRDGDYSLRVVSAGGAELGRALATVDTDRSPLSAAVDTPYASFTNLTCELPQIFDLFFSDDEQSLFFVGGHAYGTTEIDPLYPPTFYAMSPNGGGIRKIVPEGWLDQRELIPFGMLVSADGSRAVLETGTRAGAGHDYVVSTSGGALPADLPGSIRYLGFAASSNLIVGKSDSAVVTVHLPDNTVTSIWPLPPDAGAFEVLSPDRSWLLLAPEDQEQVAWLVGLKGQGPVRLGSGLQAAWSPDSRHVALVRDGLAVVLGVDGSVIQTFVPPSDVPSFAPPSAGSSVEGSVANLSWSSDSERLSMVAVYGDSCRGGLWRRVLVGDVLEGTVETAFFGDLTHPCGVHELATRTDAVSGRSQLAPAAPVLDLDFRSEVSWSPNDEALVDFEEGAGDASLLLPLDERPVLPLLAQFADVSHQRFSPTGRGLLFNTGDGAFDSCHDTRDPQQVLFRSLMNLTADLRVRPVVGAAGFLLEGSAVDLHFSRFTLEYANVVSPSVWSPIVPPSSTPVLDAPFTTWVAPAPGSYLVRLTVEDQAGNARRVVRTLSSTAHPIIDGAFLSPRYFSPNGDGVLDRATLRYRLLAPAHFDVRIFDSSRRLVRVIPQDQTDVGQTFAVDWDGRDAAGRVVPDGPYSVELLGYTFQVTVAARPLAVSLVLRKAMQCLQRTVYDSPPRFMEALFFYPTLAVSGGGSWAPPVVEEVESGDGPAPLLWSPALEGVLTEAQYDGKSFRARVSDQAGNTAVSQVPPGPSEFFFTGVGNPEVDPRTDKVVGLKPVECNLPLGIGPVVALNGPLVRVQFAETVQPALVSVAVEYQPAQMTGGSVDATLAHLTATWTREDLTAFFDAGEQLPAGAPHDTFFDAEWTAPANVGAALALRFRATDAAGGVSISPIVFVTQPGGLLLEPFLNSGSSFAGLLQEIDLHPPTDAVAGLQNSTGFPLESVTLTVQSTEDPRFRAPVSYTAVASSASQFLFASADWKACTTYSFRVVAESSPRVDPLTGAVIVQTFTVQKSGKGRCVGLEAELKEGEGSAGSVCDARPPARRTLLLTPHSLDGTLLQLLTVEGPGGVLFSLPNPARERQVEVPIEMSEIPLGGALLRCRLTDVAGHEDLVSVAVFAENSLPEGTITYPTDGARVCGIDNHFEIRGHLSDALQGLRYMLVIAGGDEPLGASGTAPTPSWDGVLGSLSAAGSFDAHLELENLGGYGFCTPPIHFTVDALVEGAAVAAGEKVFSPNGDGVQEQETASVTASEPAHATVEVWPGFVDSSGACHPEPFATAVRRLPGEAALPDSPAIAWDGLDDQGGPAAERNYLFIASLRDACGNTKTVASKCFDLDRTLPVVTIDAPQETDILGLIVEIRGSIVEKNPGFETLEYASGADLDVWLPVKPPKEPVPPPRPGPGRLLGLWNTYGLAGDYVLRLRVGDRAGNVTEVRRRITLANAGSIVTDLGVEPHAFSPNADGRVDTTAIRFALGTAATVDLRVVDAEGHAVRTLLHASLLSSGASQAAWDGRDDGGAVVADGEYRAILDAQVAGNAAVTDQQEVSLVVDATPPAIALVRPSVDGFVGPTGSVIGSVTDVNLSAWSVELAPGAAGPWTVLGTGTQELSGAALAPLDGLEEGAYALRVKAEDEAGNVRETIVPFMVDTKPPQVTVTSPAPGSFASGALAPIPVLGTVVEEHPKTWRAEVGAGAHPTSWITVGNGTGAPLASLANWDPTGFVDGDWTLRVVAEDAAGQIGEARVPVVVDNTPPAAALTQPAEAGAVSGPSAILGTASDAHFAGFELAVAPAGSSTFSVFGAGSAGVTDGSLWNWNALPPDGDVTLRLEANDRAGNRTTLLRHLRIHTRPPAPPLDLVATAEHRDVHLSWQASIGPNVAGYRVYRGGAALPGTVVSTSSVDVGLDEGTYSYRVTAVDEDGLESERSNQAIVNVDASAPIAILSRPLPNSAHGGVVEIIGTASSPHDFREYRLFAVGSGGDALLLRRSSVPQLAAVLGQWSTVGLAESSAYVLRLESEDLAGNIAAAEVAVTVDNVAPAAPTGLVATVDGNTVHLGWAPNVEPDLAGYLLYRDGRIANAHGPVIGDLSPYILTTPSQDDLAVLDGTHTYAVLAVDRAENQSPPSAPADAVVETGAPHAVFVAPIADEEFQDSLHVLATTADEDVAVVRFAWRLGAGAWTEFDPITAAPWELVWDSTALAFGDYELRAVATDRDGHVDPAPATVVVHHRYLATPPDPIGLTARVDGGDVHLDWQPGEPAPADFAGYLVDRLDPDGARMRLTPDPIPSTSFVDAGRPDGIYTYLVVAVNTFGNQSGAATGDALVRTPRLVQAYTPTASSHAILEGSEVEPGSSVAGTRVASAGVAGFGPTPADAEGGFVFEDVPLELGEQSLAVAATDALGNVTKTASVPVLRVVRPSPPVGLAASESETGIALTWSPNDSAEGVIGYRIFRDGAAAPGPAAVSGLAATAPTPDAGSPQMPAAAVDGNPDTFWRPDAGALPLSSQALELQLPAVGQVAAIELQWTSEDLGGDTVVHGPGAFWLEGWDGRVWVPLARPDATPAAITRLDLPQPYRTDRLRVRLLPSSDLPELAEVRVLTHALDAGTSHLDTPTGGLHAYRVVAVGPEGIESLRSDEVAIRFGIPPEPVTLAGSAAGSEVDLSWTLSASPGVVAYEVLRDGAHLATLAGVDTRTYADLGRPNGVWRYTVRPIDGRGSVGALSNEVAVEVAVALPAAPALTVHEVPGGAALDLAWSPGAPGSPASSYRVRRADVPGGPYALVATTAALVFRDAPLVNGRRYYYVVEPFDALGNAGPPSNEASGTPRDGVLPSAPVIHFPAGASPFTTHQSSVAVVGSGDPGATVVLSGAGGVRTTTAAIEDEERSAPVQAGAVPSPDGRYLLLPTSGSVHLYDFDAAEAGSTLDLPLIADGAAWMADGKGLFTTETTGGGEVELDAYRFEGAQRAYLATFETLAGLAAAPGGRQVAVVGRRSGDEGIWLGDLESGSWTLRLSIDVAGLDGESLVWSPDGAQLAFVGTLPGGAGVPNLWLLRTSGTDAPTSIDAQPAEHRASFLPEGSVVFARSGAGGAELVRRLPDGSESSLATGLDEPIRPQAAPDGSAVAYRDAAGVAVLDLASGIARHRTGPFFVDDVRWVPGGYLVALGSESLRTAFAGRFEVPGVNLAPGDNLVSAKSRDEAGNLSAPSATRTLRRVLANLPDLSVAPSDLTLLPTAPLAGARGQWTAIVRNIGAVASPASTASVSLDGPQGAHAVLVAGVAVPSIAAGGETTIAAEATMPAVAGAWTLVVTVDPQGRVPQQRRDNDSAALDLRIVAQGPPTLAVATERSSYLPSEALAGTVTVFNGSEPFEGRVELAIEDANGDLAQALPPIALPALGFGQVSLAPVQVSLGGIFAGRYRLVGRLVDQDSTAVDNAAASFSVVGVAALTAGIETDRAAYVRGSTIHLTSRIEYPDGNVALSGARARLQLLRAGVAAPVVEWVRELGLLLPGSDQEVTADWSSAGAAIGAYQARVILERDGASSVEASSPLTLLPAPVRVTGTLTPSDGAPSWGVALHVDARLASAAEAVSQLPVRIRVLDGSGGELARFALSFDLPEAGGVTQGADLDTRVLGLGRRVLVLEADVPGNGTVTLDTAAIAIADRTPPAIAITQPGALAAPDVDIDATVTDALSPIDRVEASVDGGGWQRLDLRDSSSGSFGRALQDLSEGPHTLVVRAADGAGNLGSSAPRDFEVVTDAPSVLVAGIAEGGLYAASVHPAVTFSLREPGTKAILLDGLAFVSGSEVANEGEHLLVASARDAIGREASASVHFALDLSPPVVAIDGIAASVVYGSAVTPSVVVTDAHPGPATILLDGQPWSNGSVVGSEGAHLLSVDAADLVAHHTTASVAFEIDLTAPQITIQGVAPDGLYGAAVTPSVVVTDAHPATTAVLLDGAPFVGGATVGAEGAHVLAVEATDAVGHSSNASVPFAIDLTPPVIAIAGVVDGSTYGESVTPVVTVTEAHPGSTSIDVDGTPWTAGTAVAADGPHVLRVRAVDAVANESTASVSFTIDTGAPRITVTGVADAALYGHAVAPIVVIDDPNPGTRGVTLDGAAFVSGSTVATEGSHALHAEATNAFGKHAETNLSFTLDLTPPAIVVTGVDDGARYEAPVVPIVQIDDLHPDTATLTLDGIAFVSGTTVATNGNHVLAIDAVDAAANRATREVRFKIVSRALGVMFYTLTPCRLVDTRLPDGPFGGPRLGAAETRRFDLVGRCGLPADVFAVSLNVTVVNPTAEAFLAVYDAGLAQPPGVSTLNLRPGRTRANNGVLVTSADGLVGLDVVLSGGSADLLLDVTGYFGIPEPIPAVPSSSVPPRPRRRHVGSPPVRREAEWEWSPVGCRFLEGEL